MRASALSLVLASVAVAAVAATSATARENPFTNPGPGAGSFLWSVAFDPSDANTFYLGGDIEGPFKTTDGGATYTRITNGLAGGNIPADVYASQAIALDPNRPATLFLATWLGLFKSADAGATWSLAHPPELAEEANPIITSVAVSPHDGDIVLAGYGNSFENADGASTVIRSTDGGADFTEIGQTSLGLAGAETVVHDILFDPTAAGADTVYVATGEGVLRSTDNGATWSGWSTGLPPGTEGAPIVHQLAGAADAGGTFWVFATLRTQSTTTFTAGGVFRRSAGGAAGWEDITANLPTFGADDSELAFNYYKLAVHPEDPDTLYVGTRREEWAYDQMGVFKTTNALATNAAEVGWSFLFDPANITDYGWLDPTWWGEHHIGFLGIAPSAPATLVAGGDHVYKTTDAGATWTEAYATPAGENAWTGRGIELLVCFDVAFDPTDLRRWWVAYDDMGLWRTDDDGASFTRVDGHQADPATGSTDAALSLAADPADPDVLYVGRSNGTNDFFTGWNVGSVYRTDDSGASWQQLGAGLLEGGRPQVLLLPGGGSVATRTVLCAIYGKGLYRSADSGANWSAVHTAFPVADRGRIWSLASSPADPDVALAGICNADPDGGETEGGIYRSADGGATWAKLAGPTVPNNQILALAFAPDGTAFAGTTQLFDFITAEVENLLPGGGYRSSNNGATWEHVFTQPRVDAVAAAPGAASQVALSVSSRFNAVDGYAAGTYVSTDGGTTFSPCNAGLTHTKIWLTRFGPGPDPDLFVGTDGGGLFVSRGSSTPAEPFQIWLEVHFNAAERADPNLSGDNADPDGDGLDNLLEFALGHHPRQPDPAALPPTALGAGGFLTLTVDRPAPPASLTFLVQVSADLLTWQPSDPGDATFTTVLENAPTRLVVRDNTPVSAGSTQRFIRLAVRPAR